MPPEVFQFEDVTVDLRRVSVSRAGQPVALEPKIVRRASLPDRAPRPARHQGRAARRGLEGHVRDAERADARVAQLRKALGDDAFEARYIETVAKRGYRFIAPVATAPIDIASLPTADSLPMPVPPARRRWLVPAFGAHHSSRRGCRARPVYASRTGAAGITRIPVRAFAAAFYDRKSFVFVPVDFTRRPHRGVLVESVRRDGDLHCRVRSRQQRGRDHKRRRTEHVRRVVARRTVARVSLAQERRHLDRAVQRRHCATGRRLRIAGDMDARRRAPRLHVRRRRHGGAIDYLDRESRWNRSPAVDEAGGAARWSFQTVRVARRSPFRIQRVTRAHRNRSMDSADGRCRRYEAGRRRRTALLARRQRRVLGRAAHRRATTR